MFLQIKYMYEQDLVVNKLQGLICYKIQTNQTTFRN